MYYLHMSKKLPQISSYLISASDDEISLQISEEGFLGHVSDGLHLSANGKNAVFYRGDEMLFEVVNLSMFYLSKMVKHGCTFVCGDYPPHKVSCCPFSSKTSDLGYLMDVYRSLGTDGSPLLN